MRIRVDLDNVIYDWCGQVEAVLDRQAKLLGTSFEVANPKAWHLTERYAWNGEFLSEEKAQQLLEDYEINGEGAFIDGALHGLERLIEKGHKLILATSRPAITALPTMDLFTGYSDLFREIHIGGDKRLIPADVAIDDSPAIGSWVCEGDNLLFSQPWNQWDQLTLPDGGPTWSRVGGWEEVLWFVRGYE